MFPLIIPQSQRDVAEALAAVPFQAPAVSPAQALVAEALARKATNMGDEGAYEASLAAGVRTPQDIEQFRTNARRLGFSDDYGMGPGRMPTGGDDNLDYGRKPMTADIHPPGTGVRDLFRQQPTGSALPRGLPVPFRKAEADPYQMLEQQLGGAPIVKVSAPGSPKEAVPTVVGKNLTEGQSKDTVFVTRALGAMPLLDKYGGALTDWVPEAAGKLPFGWGANMQSADYQRGEQAGQEFLSALLRKDTGATITPDEQAYYTKMYLPQPGNKPELLEQKRAARARAVMGMQLGLPPEVIVAFEKAGMNPVVPSQTRPRDDLKSKYGLE